MTCIATFAEAMKRSYGILFIF